MKSIHYIPLIFMNVNPRGEDASHWPSPRPLYIYPIPVPSSSENGGGA
jgi:hypothetical protein